MAGAQSLLRALGLTIVTGGPNGRYPCAEPGPATGYRYWANVFDGRCRFGIQTNPKAELESRVLAAFEGAGFSVMPKRTEAFMVLSSPLGDAVDEARVVMVKVERLLATVSA